MCGGRGAPPVGEKKNFEMPNQATRRRRRQAGLPSNVQRLDDGDKIILVSRLGTKQVASSCFLVLGGSPDVLMSWLSPFMNAGTGFRVECAPSYTVWVYRSIEAASAAIQHFSTRNTMELPPFVPSALRHTYMFLMDVVNPSEDMQRLITMF